MWFQHYISNTGQSVLYISTLPTEKPHILWPLFSQICKCNTDTPKPEQRCPTSTCAESTLLALLASLQGASSGAAPGDAAGLRTSCAVSDGVTDAVKDWVTTRWVPTTRRVAAEVTASSISIGAIAGLGTTYTEVGMASGLSAEAVEGFEAEFCASVHRQKEKKSKKGYTLYTLNLQISSVMLSVKVCTKRRIPDSSFQMFWSTHSYTFRETDLLTFPVKTQLMLSQSCWLLSCRWFLGGLTHERVVLQQDASETFLRLVAAFTYVLQFFL